MASIQGEAWHQGTPFPAMWEELIGADYVCRVIDAFVGRWEMETLEPNLEQLELADGEEEVEADKLWAPLVRRIRRELR